MRSALDTHNFPYQEKKMNANSNQNDENLEKKFIVDQNTKPKYHIPCKMFEEP